MGKSSSVHARNFSPTLQTRDESVEGPKAEVEGGDHQERSAIGLLDRTRPMVEGRVPCS